MDDEDGFDDFDDDFDEDEFLAAWEEADRHAATVLREAVPEVLDSEPPMDEVARAADRIRAEIAAGSETGRYFATACGWGEPPRVALMLWLGAAASTISPQEDPGTDPELQASVFSMQHADWLALIVGLVRRGVGAPLDADLVADDLAAMPEIDTDEPPEGDDYTLAVEALVPLWQTLGAIDDDRRLTPLGWWGLPRTLYMVWSMSGHEDEDPPGELTRLDDADTDVAVDLLREKPMSVAELRAACAAKEIFTDEESLYGSIIHRVEVWELEDGRFAHVPTLTDDLVLTHRVTEEELDLDALDASFDLALYSILADPGLPLAGGGTLTAVHGGPQGVPQGWLAKLTGPEGWLSGIEAGGLVALRMHDGEVGLERVDTTSDADAAALREAAWQAARDADPTNRNGFEGVSTDDIVMLARTQNPDVLSRPAPPLRELLTDIGLEMYRHDLGVPGTSWYGEPRLPDDQRAAYYAWRRALTAYGFDAEPEPDDLAAAASLAGEALDLAAVDAARQSPCGPLLESIQDLATGAARARILYLRAREAEARLDGPVFVSFLEQVVAADATLVDAVADLAEVRAIQGDTAEAHRLFGLAEVDPSYPDRVALGRFLQPPAGEVGRNQPCPCGSGKKYKVCHGRSARHPLPDRAEWLWVKIKSFAQRGVNYDEMLDWAELLVGAEVDDPEALERAMSESTTWEFAVFDGEILERFVALHGGLLPDDELALVRDWQGSSRRLLEVSSTHLTGLTARDLQTEETVELRDRTLPRGVEGGDLLLGRFLDPGDGVVRPWDDPLGIPRMWRSRLLAALRDGIDPHDLATMLAPGGPPEVRTGDGEEMLFCVARYRVADVEGVWRALAEPLEEHDDVLHLIDDGDATIRGTVTRGDDVVTLEAMSLERLRRLQGILLEAAPDAQQIDESVRTPADMLADGPADGAGSEPIELGPEDRAEIGRIFEDRWLSESIPALEGRTPYEAAEDPRLRKELVALLDDFEVVQRGESGITMDVERLREELGL